MKYNSYFLLACLAMLNFACKDGYIDEISPVAPGADVNAPEVNVIFPAEGTKIRVTENITSINIRFEVKDDIEIGNIKVLLDGKEIGSYSEFKDYRRALVTHPYSQLGNGTHVLNVTATDLSGKTTEQTINFEKSAPYQPKYDGEVFYAPFDGENLELITLKEATLVGSPGFTLSRIAGTNAYAGATGAYLTFPTAGLLHKEFSAAFWYKINPSPDRAGILVIGPPDTANPNSQNNRTSGFRLFREGSATRQTFKLNVGNGAADSWFDGGNAASINPTTNTDWIHIAFTISDKEAAVYIDGQLVSKGSFLGVDWKDCDILSIMSGAPRFAGWNHLSDRSFMDELRIFNKALTQEQIQNIIADEKP
ncbi:LamG-like jellyroll fold domain-containing protein [Algoriphagus mannitolivorans]|uniref:LamG-like jellyroll fold domain-containing protein n=1 Tax=Algoriphagus mannitolivorans TaxID=226504 RepID=UPI0003F9DF28|nr:LamG-like jellyroll fold domain-containing protein [Algoriphagus mannitolivorans]